MPRCFVCNKRTPPPQLRTIGWNNRGVPEDELACPTCRRKRLTHVVSKQEVTVMAKNEQPKPIFTLEVFENGKDDYRVVINAKVGGLRLEVDKTVEEIRDFFTKRKERRLKGKDAEVRKLKSVE